MGVIHRIGPTHPCGATSRDSREDRDAALLFLRSQSAWLRRGLEAADDPARVGIVLGVHEASHERWLAVIGGLGANDDPSAPAVAALYEFHGRVVGFLECGLGRRLDFRVCKGIRSLLSARLRQLTADTVTAVERAATAGATPGPWTTHSA